MANPVVHFEIMSKRSDDLKQFYANVFDWDFHNVPGADSEAKNTSDYALVDRNDDCGIGGAIGSASQGYGGHVTFYVGVDKIEAALAKIGKHGGSLMMGPEQVPGGPRYALFRDPEDHVIGLLEIDANRA